MEEPSGQICICRSQRGSSSYHQPPQLLASKEAGGRRWRRGGDYGVGEDEDGNGDEAGVQEDGGGRGGGGAGGGGVGAPRRGAEAAAQARPALRLQLRALRVPERHPPRLRSVQSICFFLLLCVLLTASLPRSPPAKLPPFPFRFYPGPWGVERRRDDVHFFHFFRALGSNE